MINRRDSLVPGAIIEVYTGTYAGGWVPTPATGLYTGCMVRGDQHEQIKYNGEIDHPVLSDTRLWQLKKLDAIYTR